MPTDDTFLLVSGCKYQVTRSKDCQLLFVFYQNKFCLDSVLQFLPRHVFKCLVYLLDENQKSYKILWQVYVKSKYTNNILSKYLKIITARVTIG